MSLPHLAAAATSFGNKDFVFHVKSDGSLHYYQSQNPEEAALKPYNDVEIEQDGDVVQADENVSLVTAVAYRDPIHESEEIRVYYVSKGDRKLRELRRTNGGDWKNGKTFNDIGLEVADGGSLTSNVAFGQLKVYFHSKTQDKGKITCVYANLGVGNWSSHSKIN